MSLLLTDRLEMIHRSLHAVVTVYGAAFEKIYIFAPTVGAVKLCFLGGDGGGDWIP